MRWFRGRPASALVAPATETAVPPCAWVRQPDRTFQSPRQERCEAFEGQEIIVEDDGDWRIHTQIDGVRIMASGRGDYFARGKMEQAKALALRAAAILHSHGARGGLRL